MQTPDQYRQLIQLLEKAAILLSKHQGGSSKRIPSSAIFHADLLFAIDSIKMQKRQHIYQIYFWFSPEGDWEEIVGAEGMELGREIFRLTVSLNRQGDTVDASFVEPRRHSLWNWIKAFISSDFQWPF